MLGLALHTRGSGGGVNPEVYYNRPYLTQTVSYSTYDEAWRRINGGNDYNDAIPDDAYIQQVQPDFVNGRYDYLKYPNIWGHNFRFCGENGGYYDEADGTYRDVNGNLSDLATEFPATSGQWFVYVHLTGYRLANGRGGARTWLDAMNDSIGTTWAGVTYNGVVFSKEEAIQLNNNMNVEESLASPSNRPFFTLGLSTFWTGSTKDSNITLAIEYIYLFLSGSTEQGTKTSTGSVTYYFYVFDNGTIPQP